MAVTVRPATFDDWRAVVEIVATEVRKSKHGLDKAEQACNELPSLVMEKIEASKAVVAEYNGRLVGAAVGVYSAATSDELKVRLSKALKDLA